MKRDFKVQLLAAWSLIALSIAGCSSNENNNMNSDNFLLAQWTGDYGGVPAFDQMKAEELAPALRAAMEEKLSQIDEITANSDYPTFENTILELERSGKTYDRVSRYYYIMISNLSSPEVREVQQEMAPEIAEFNTKISQNEALFSRIKSVYEQSKAKPLGKDEQRTVELTYDRFAHEGAELDGEAKRRYAAINKELSGLYTRFSNNVLADEEGYITYLTQGQLSGLSQSFVNAAAEVAKENGQEGKFAITNTRSVVEPFLTFSDERDLREKVWKTYKSRGDNGDDKDNKELIARIMKLRDERVKLMGYDNYASWRLSNRMAKNPENALRLLNEIWPAATARIQQEVADMQKIAGNTITIEPWDYLYYSEKVRKDKYDLDSEEVKKYLQLEQLREAMFFVASEVFDFEFKPVPDGKVPVFHPDVKVWEVHRKSTGGLVGLWYLDPYARKGKRSGAWATTYRSYSSFDGEKTVLSSNNSNFIKPAEGEPTLVSWSDAETFFHEFGHALHYLCSQAKYPAEDNMVWDFVEFQSQLLERWLITDQVIERYFKHYETGESMPAELVEKIKAAATFNQGYETGEYLASALVDMTYHTLADPSDLNAESFEIETLKQLNMPNEIAMRHRSPHFSHIFSGEGYASAYYSYIWADVLTSDAAEMLEEAPGGYYDKEVAANMVKYLFAPRNSIDPSEAFRLFRGRDPQIDALMRDRGFPVPE